MTDGRTEAELQLLVVPVSEDLLRQIEQGLGNPTARTLALLARALDARLALVSRKAG